MVAQRMGSQVGGSKSTGSTQTRIRTQDPNPNPNPLARQVSLYNLTIDEVQTQLGDLGKPLSSMNLDELLKTVWAAEANNQEANGLDFGPSGTHFDQKVPDPSVNRLSSHTLSRDLSKKTVDEVWQDIQQGQKRNNLDRNATLGTITLEDFLLKAGVAESAKDPGSGLGSIGMPEQAPWISFSNPMVHAQQGMVPVFMPGGSIEQPLMGGTLSDTQTLGRKRVAPGDVVEKNGDRRHKRMIKNRESAARSRARKQAYTHELENKVSCLEEEIERLKRQKEWETALPSVPQPEPKYQLRRTSSAPI